MAIPQPPRPTHALNAMTEGFTTRKEFVSLHAEFPVRYTFLSKEV